MIDHPKSPTLAKQLGHHRSKFSSLKQKPNHYNKHSATDQSYTPPLEYKNPITDLNQKKMNEGKNSNVM